MKNKTILKTIITALLIGNIYHSYTMNQNFCPKKKKIKTTVVNEKNNIWTYIAENNWKLIQLNGKTIENDKITIRFNINGKNCGGMGICNKYSGAFTVMDDLITFGPIVSTKMACFNNSASESEYFNTLSEGKFTFDVADQTLNLYLNQKLVLIFGKTMEE